MQGLNVLHEETVYQPTACEAALRVEVGLGERGVVHLNGAYRKAGEHLSESCRPQRGGDAGNAARLAYLFQTGYRLRGNRVVLVATHISEYLQVEAGWSGKGGNEGYEGGGRGVEGAGNRNEDTAKDKGLRSP